MKSATQHISVCGREVVCNIDIGGVHGRTGILVQCVLRRKTPKYWASYANCHPCMALPPPTTSRLCSTVQFSTNVEEDDVCGWYKKLKDSFKPHGILTFAVNFLAHWERHLFENLNGIFLKGKVCLCYAADW